MEVQGGLRQFRWVLRQLLQSPKPHSRELLEKHGRCLRLLAMEVQGSRRQRQVQPLLAFALPEAGEEIQRCKTKTNSPNSWSKSTSRTGPHTSGTEYRQSAQMKSGS